MVLITKANAYGFNILWAHLVVASVRGASVFEPLVRLLHLEAVCFPTGVATRHNMSGSLAAVHTQNNSTDARGNLMFSGN